MDDWKYKIIEIAEDMAGEDGLDYSELSDKDQLKYYGKAYEYYLDRPEKANGGIMRILSIMTALIIGLSLRVRFGAELLRPIFSASLLTRTSARAARVAARSLRLAASLFRRRRTEGRSIALPARSQAQLRPRLGTFQYRNPCREPPRKL